MTVELRKHQLIALEKMKNGCILKGDVGSGKSITSAAYFYIKVCGGDININGFGGFGGIENPKDVVVITTARKRDELDWHKEFAKFGISTKRETSVYGIQLTVDSWNNIGKYEKVKDAFFIFDEQRLVGSGAWVNSFKKIAKWNEWILLSATPGDVWQDYIPVFVAHGFYKNKTDFMRQHAVMKPYSRYPKVERFVETGKLLRYKQQLIVDMPMERHTIRHEQTIMVENDKQKFERVSKERWNIYEDRPIRDVAELFRVMRMVVNTEPSRMEMVRQTLRQHDRLIIWYNFNYELDLLREMAQEFEWGDREVAEWNGQKHEPVPESKKWIYFVQYTAGAEGWNCITTDAMLFYSLNYSYKIMQQAKGRTDRMNTPFKHLYYYILRTNSMIDNAILRSLSVKKTFNELEFLENGR